MNEQKRRRPALYAPAGDWECARAAVAAGADAVYFGLPRFNARMRATNFRAEELGELVNFLHRYGVRAVAALNVLIYEAEMADALFEIARCAAAGVDAVIVQDVGLAVSARAQFPKMEIHASTQMSITTIEGVEFARDLGARQVVLARETSLADIEKCTGVLPLEVFVHGALCVGYSGQCLASKALGGRSGNRGECAQPCRLPYTLVADGTPVELGHRCFLLSPQDLAAIREIPALVQAGVAAFKIEGRMRSPEYVALVTSIYRRAIDFLEVPSEDDIYRLEMAFSRGLSTGWLHGKNHKTLVLAEFSKNRGVLAGQVISVGSDSVKIAPESRARLKRGDGVAFENTETPDNEEGGKIFAIRDRGNAIEIFFKNDKIDFSKLRTGMRMWKTSDDALDAEVRKIIRSRPTVRQKIPLDLIIEGCAGEKLRIRCGSVQVESQKFLAPAEKFALDEATLREAFSRLGDTAYELAHLDIFLEGRLFLPKSEFADMRRQLVAELDEARSISKRKIESVEPQLPTPIPNVQKQILDTPILSALVRTPAQLEVALEAALPRIYIEYKNLLDYRRAVQRAQGSPSEIFVATPHIQQPGDEKSFATIADAGAHGVLVRNAGGLAFFKKHGARMVGDFSLNIANSHSARYFIEQGIERLTISYDLEPTQILDLLRAANQQGFLDFLEVSFYRHTPSFHTAHCLYAAFLSQGETRRDCGRPCEQHCARMVSRTGLNLPIHTDSTCCNTIFCGQAHRDEHTQSYLAQGLRHFRIEFLDEEAPETHRLLQKLVTILA